MTASGWTSWIGCATPARSSRATYGHHPGAVAVERLVEQPQRHPDARVHDDARRSRDRRAQGARAGVGPARARFIPQTSWPSRRTRRTRLRGERRLKSLGIARVKSQTAGADRADRRGHLGRGGRGGRGEGRPGGWTPTRSMHSASGSPGALRSCRRSTGSPTTGSGPLNFLTSSTSSRYTSRWTSAALAAIFALPILHGDELIEEGRYHRRPQGRRTSSERPPPRREVHQGHDRWHPRRDRVTSRNG